MATVLRVKGMSCQHCVMSVTKALNQLDGVQNVQVDLQKGEVRFDNTKGIVLNRIEKAITDVLVEGKVRTYDLGGTSSTSQVAEAISEKLRRDLRP